MRTRFLVKYKTLKAHKNTYFKTVFNLFKNIKRKNWKIRRVMELIDEFKASKGLFAFRRSSEYFVYVIHLLFFALMIMTSHAICKTTNLDNMKIQSV